jgi:hypothetical protein
MASDRHQSAVSEGSTVWLDCEHDADVGFSENPVDIRNRRSGFIGGFEDRGQFSWDEIARSVRPGTGKPMGVI